MKINGGCHCGLVSYEAEIDPDRIGVCHCSDCQTLSGAPFRAIARTLAGSFKLLAGELKIYVKTAESGNKRKQSFCPECGTPIYSTSTDDNPSSYALRVGSIHQRDLLVPKLQIWTSSEQKWVSGLNSVERREKG